MKKLKRLLVLVLALSLLALPIGVSAIGTSADVISDEDEIRGYISSYYIKSVIDLIDSEYRFDADKTKMYEAVLDYVMNEHPEMLEGAIKAVTDTLDQHSTYLTKEELQSFINSVENIYVGIGVTIEECPEGLKVVEVNEVGGAFDAGIQVGDIIFEADGHNINGLSLDEGRQYILGDEGTSVRLKIRRGDAVLEMSVIRKKIYAETVSYGFTDDKIGYIDIAEFATSTPESLKKALYEFKNAEIKKMVINLRNNPGGTLESAIKSLELFVPKGRTITEIQYNNKEYNRKIKSNADFLSLPDRKIVILVNEETASAAELFSGTMQNLKYAKVVGVRSYGKGSMQEFIGMRSPLDYNLGDIKLSLAEFTKPDGSKINGVGITPDKVVKNSERMYEEEDFTPMGFNAKYTVGDVAKDVLAIEERLCALGYLSEDKVDETFDTATENATKKFQESLELHPYGVMDYTTQQAVKNEVLKVTYFVDEQLNEALKMLK